MGEHRFCQSCGEVHCRPTEDYYGLRGKYCNKCIRSDSGPRGKYCISCGGVLPLRISNNRYGAFESTKGLMMCKPCRIRTTPADKIASLPESEIDILGECSCSYHRTKHRHHPDYSSPLQVFVMCSSCHRIEHAIINYCEKHGVYDSPFHIEKLSKAA